MMMTKVAGYTPGPWRAYEHPDHPGETQIGAGDVGASGDGWDDWSVAAVFEGMPEANANARLIAAAPDHALIAAALASGRARWEHRSGDSGEVCANGFCYLTKLDEFGVPFVNGVIRKALS